MVLCCLGTTCSWQLTHLHIQRGGRGIQPFQNPTEDRPGRIPTLSTVALLPRPDHARWQIRNRKKEAPLLLTAWLFRREKKICKIYVFSFLASFPVPYIGRRSHHSRIFVERRFPPPPPPPPNPRKTLVGAFPSLQRVEREASRRRTRLSAQLS